MRIRVLVKTLYSNLVACRILRCVRIVERQYRRNIMPGDQWPVIVGENRAWHPMSNVEVCEGAVSFAGISLMALSCHHWHQK